jgi:hypothetical protein
MTDKPSSPPLSRLDRWLGAEDLHAAGLNWKGRAIQRMWLLKAKFRAPVFHPVRRLDDRLGIGHIHGLELNWKGRSIERAYAIWFKLRARLRGLRDMIALRSRLVNLFYGTINATGFAIYWTLGRLRRPTRVRSVLQLSILSHKPYMVSRALRDEGLKSDCFMLNVGVGKSILDVGWDYGLRADLSPRKRRLLEHVYLWTVLARYDVIHSHFKTFLSDTGWELDYLRRLGKVLVFQFRGCDVRHRSLNMRLQPVLNCCQECEYPVGSCDTPYQFQQVGIAMNHADLLFVTTPDLIDFVKGSEHIPFIHPVGVNFDGIVAAKRAPGVFRVVTSSNHDGIDGTRFIRAAVERLGNEGWPIELIEVNNMPYADALAMYKSADVYVGKLRMGYYNNANIETMLLGVPNMSYIRDDFRSMVPDCPIIVTRPGTVYDRLSEYIGRRDELKAIGARGPAFVKAHHDPHLIMQRVIARYNEALQAKG